MTWTDCPSFKQLCLFSSSLLPSPRNPYQATKRASIKLSHKAPNFTKRQDLKLTAGMDLDWTESTQKPKMVRSVDRSETLSSSFPVYQQLLQSQ